jgi:cephalosporin hydroxylase
MSDNNRTVEDQLDSRLGDYYLQRVRIHEGDSYAGIRMRKFPEDLHTFEHLLWDEKVDVVVEIGTGHGSSALWFRDRLRTLASYRNAAPPLVVSIDVDVTSAHENLGRVDPTYSRTITLVEADIRDPGTVDEVRRHLPDGARVLVVEDTAHRYDTTMAALRYFSSLVAISSFMVVEDGHRDIPGMLPEEMPSLNGALVAVEEWLGSEGAGRFVQRRDQERYIVTSNPGGWLQRVR